MTPHTYKDPITIWIVRVWEDKAPEGEEPLEWVLLTSVPTTTLEQAWEHVEWYRHRWRVEDYHHCLKSGFIRAFREKLGDKANQKSDGIAMRLIQHNWNRKYTRAFTESAGEPKSGCHIEQRQLQTVDGLLRLLGLMSPLAVRGYADTCLRSPRPRTTRSSGD